jgi:tRNA (guanine-N7-)-methyltransferase
MRSDETERIHVERAFSFVWRHKIGYKINNGVVKMRLRNITGSQEKIAESKYVIQNAALQRGRWKEVFGNDNPLCIEIGMGKGRFLYTMAQRYPNINFVGIEKYSSVLLRGIQKLEEREMPNIRLVRMDAEDIFTVFGENEVDKIYLNFSDPWPKDRHAKRRLPSRQFLNRYRCILNQSGTMEFKTDNQKLFDFALEELDAANWEKKLVTRNLHADAKLMENNCLTEYEEKFSQKGNPIYKVIATPPTGDRENVALQEGRMEELDMELKITADNFEKEVLQSDLPVLVDFYADWCGPCKMMAPVVEKMAEKYAGKVKVGKCNSDENMKLAIQYKVSSIPTFLIFKGGEVVESRLGAMSEKDFEENLLKKVSN